MQLTSKRDLNQQVISPSNAMDVHNLLIRCPTKKNNNNKSKRNNLVPLVIYPEGLSQ